MYETELEQIITDDRSIYESLREYALNAVPELYDGIILYSDDYSLGALYSLEKNINNAVNDTLVIGTNGNDAITNSGEYAIVNGGKGNIPFAVRQIMLSL